MAGVTADTGKTVFSADKGTFVLGPLQKAETLGSLDCRKNEIQTLEPLRDLKLDYLDCSDNRLETLEPFVGSRTPPKIFVFDCRTLPDQEIRRAIDDWSAKNLTFNVSYAELLLALRHNDFLKVRSLATQFEGHRYLFVQTPMRVEDAKQFCARVDGHLVTITSKDENEFLTKITPPSVSCRIGLIVSNGEPQWVTPEKAGDFVRAMTDFRASDSTVTWKDAVWLPIPLRLDKPMPCIIEWDETETERP